MKSVQPLSKRQYPLEQVKRIGSKLDHSEGIAVSADGTVYAGGEAGQVYRISADGQTTTEIARTGGFTLGITEDRANNLYICDMIWRAVMKVEPSGQLSVFADSAENRKFRTPNFTVFDSDGNLYLTDSGEWKRNNGLIYKISPTGMAFDAHGNLYVGCFGLNRIYAVDPQGRVELLCEDTENATISVPTNCAFGGKNFDQLYFACMGASSIAVLDLKTRGQPLYAHKDRLASGGAVRHD